MAEFEELLDSLGIDPEKEEPLDIAGLEGVTPGESEEIPDSEPENSLEDGGEDQQEEAEEPSELETLRATVAELSSRIQQLQIQQPKQEPVELKDQEFVTEEEFDSILSSPAGLNSLLNQVFRKGVAAARESTLQHLPGIVQQATTEQISKQQFANEFYGANKDLADKKDYVLYVASTLAEKNPEWTPQKLFSELGTEVRNRLGIKKAAKSSAPKPNTVRRPNGRQMSETARDVLELLRP